MPALSILYGITWADIETMPAYERRAYLTDLARHLADEGE